MLRILCLLAFISTAMACNCTQLPPNEAICAADWVSRVKVIAFHNPYEDDSGRYDAMYTVEHVHYFKSSHSRNPLPPVFFMPSNEVKCFNLSIGKEYVLAGTFATNYEPNVLRVSYCDQVTENQLDGIKEYHSISEALLLSLQTYKC
ncbi:TIMP metallopeptidase inhibitor 2 [Parelaphostrongylus tenuis]|uniref:TIMP metallopeptidase inhibitor 2 n=1 Tax=Parelaphostrongylus tenuis TaxID=148309 RepID=A0AAD5QL60_PARTN|nr:TIMP metallopeptidase inhibitor 2 [Parelaphostrongylus tenuis]